MNNVGQISKLLNRWLVAATMTVAVLVAAPTEIIRAETPRENAILAKQYRLKAEALEQKAIKHEENAKHLRNRSANPMAQKWPSMVQNNWQKEGQLAIQARRAAEECYKQAARHLSLAVESDLAGE